MSTDKKGTGFSLKDQLFNRNRVQYLADLFQAADSDFHAESFVKETMKGFKKLELKQRIVHITSVLEKYLDADYTIAAKQITAALPSPLDPTKTDDDFGDFIFAPLGEFVVRNGLQKKHLKTSLRTLKEITQRFTMEDAIRAFINTHTDPTLQELEKWARDKNYHVRRLVSEGTRAMLPWAKRLTIETTRPLPFLSTLHADPTRYVTRSVANHLNDIAKTHPELVVNTLKEWKQANRQAPPELQWMTKHALRTLVKKGDAKALQLLGFRPNPKIDVDAFALEAATIRPGQAIDFSFCVKALRDESLVVDYIIDFVKANGTLAPKVHKLKQVHLKKGESVVLTKRHVLKANATTYTLYPGTHQVTLQINGKKFDKLPFELTEAVS